jgi:hypothetical protein
MAKLAFNPESGIFWQIFGFTENKVLKKTV